MLLPDTATRSNSIWDKVGRAEFDRDVVSLKDQTHVPGPSHVYKLDDNSTVSSPFSLAIERQIADDVAFIAAFREGARSVTAVALELEDEGLRVVLAANDGIKNVVKKALDKIFRILEDCARLSEPLSKF